MTQNVRSASQRRSSSSTTPAIESDIPLSRQCGLLRYGRYQGRFTMFYRPRCGRRRCTVCLPHVITKKITRVPDEIIYGQITTAAKFAAGLRNQLARARKRGECGDFMRIPVSADQILVVSDNEQVGFPIDRTVIVRYMTEALPEWGSITSSAAWRAKKLAPSADFVDEGIATAPVEEIARTAEKLHLRPIENPHSVAYRTTDAQHEAWKFLARVHTDAEYWEHVRGVMAA